MLKYQLIITPLLLSLMSTSAFAGVVLGATRVVYESEQEEATLTLTNTREKGAFLVQSWVSSDENKVTKTPFIITPPLFKLGAAKKNILRIVNVDGGLPEDRESLFWINVKPIPASDSENRNELQVIVKSTLKLIYRPAALHEQAESAYKNIVFTQNGKGLDIYNPAAVYISLNNLDIDGKKEDDVSLLPPLSHIKVNTHGVKVNSISWQAITDNGSLTNTMNYHF